MITKEQALKLGGQYGQMLIHANGCQRHVGPRGGITDKVEQWRPSGQCKTWKRDQARFRLPIKFGMYGNSEITNQNCDQFHLASDCPILIEA